MQGSKAKCPVYGGTNKGGTPKNRNGQRESLCKKSTFPIKVTE